MKKVLLFAIILGGTVAFTSCGKDECVCTQGGNETKYTEDDVQGDGNLEDACKALDALVKIGSASDGCEMK